MINALKKDYKKMSHLRNTINIESRNNIPPHISKIITNNIKDSRFCPKLTNDYLKSCDNYTLITSEQSPIKYHIFKNSVASTDSLSNIIDSYIQATTINKFFNINKHFDIYIILSPFKRFFPKSHCAKITADNINGGFTNINNKEIFILRLEEYQKVILHEIMHHSYINNMNWNKNNINLLKTHFKISNNTWLEPNEAIIELYATILNSLFVSIKYNIPFKIILNKELEYSLQLCQNIKDKHYTMKLWHEDTNAYCYIIFKTILLKNYNKLKINIPYDTNYITAFLINNDIPYIKSPKQSHKSLKIMKFSNY